MATKNAVLLIGLIPELIDFAAIGMPQMSAGIIRGGLEAELTRFKDAGFEPRQLLIDMGETAEGEIQRALAEREYACIVIGAGLRAPPPHLVLFEKVLNVLHEHAPRSKIAFNTSPTDSLVAVGRWIRETTTPG